MMAGGTGVLESAAGGEGTLEKVSCQWGPFWRVPDVACRI